jgi:hypothetical protein
VREFIYLGRAQELKYFKNESGRNNAIRPPKSREGLRACFSMACVELCGCALHSHAAPQQTQAGGS